jgi:hypothetical protein
MAIIFNSITQFERQPERTKTRVKRNELDTLTEIWVGPSGLEDVFIPAFGTVHSDYNLMNMTNSSVKRLPGSVSEVTLTYTGKLANGSSTGYTSVPTIGRSWMEGEVSYQVNSAAGFTVAMPGGGFTSLTQLGVATYSRRYTGRCVEIAYITNRIPSGNATMLGAAKGFLGFLNVSDVFSGFSAGTQLSGGGSPFEQMVCTDVRVVDQATGWYQVTETYQSRMFPGNPGVPIPSVSASRPPSKPQDNVTGAQGSGISTNTLQTTEAQIMQINQVYNSQYPLARQASEGAASSAGVTLPDPSPIGTAGYSTTQETAMDPALGDVGNLLTDYIFPAAQAQALAAADSANSPSGNQQTSYDSTFLDY